MIISTGVAVLEAAILTAAAVIGLTLFTFWAVKRGYEFSFMFPFLFTSLVSLLVYLIIQVPSLSCNTIFISTYASYRAAYLTYAVTGWAWTIQLCFPLGRVGATIYGLIGTVVFSGFIVYDTNMLLKRYTYNEYITAAISLYLDVINLFNAQLSLTAGW